MRFIAGLGRLDKIQETKKSGPPINGLARAAGRAQNDDGDIVYEFVTEHGSLLALDGLWRELGFDNSLRRALRSERRKFDAEELIRVMVSTGIATRAANWESCASCERFPCRAFRRGGRPISVCSGRWALWRKMPNAWRRNPPRASGRFSTRN